MVVSWRGFSPKKWLVCKRKSQMKFAFPFQGITPCVIGNWETMLPNVIIQSELPYDLSWPSHQSRRRSAGRSQSPSNRNGGERPAGEGEQQEAPGRFKVN